MSKTEDGGPAFPNTVRIDNEEFASLRGMSLRDYFAAKALAPILQSAKSQREVHLAAQAAYAMADAMLKAREA